MVLGKWDERRTARLIAPVVCASVLLAGCITTTTHAPSTRAAEPVSVAVMLVRDDVTTRDTRRPPQALVDAVTESLDERNLKATLVGELGYDDSIAAIPSTSGRLTALSRKAGDAPLVLLVETSAAFYSQLSGRYRWTVDTRLTLAPTADLARGSSVEVQDPAFLFYDHQREDEAISEVAARVGRQLGALSEEALLTGWPGLPAGLLPGEETAMVAPAEEPAEEIPPAKEDTPRPF